MNKRKKTLQHTDFLLIDIICLFFSFLISFLIRHKTLASFIDEEYINLLLIIQFVNILFYLFYEPFNNVLNRGYLIELKEELFQNIISLLFVILFLFIVKYTSKYSRIVIVLTYIINLFLSYLCRVSYKHFLLKRSISSLQTGNDSMIIICKEKELENVIKDISVSNYHFHRIAGICVCDKNLKGKIINGYNVVANIDDILSYISTNWVDEIYIATKLGGIPKTVLKGFEESRIPLHIKLEKLPINSNNQIVEKIGNQFVISTSISNRSNYQIIVKRLMDIVGGLVGCLITIILIIIIGPIIYYKSPGNIFYVSDRVGKNGKIFKFYKFRSMILNADDYKKELSSKNRNKDNMMFKLDDDPRIIPGIGSFIRKTSLDEFPQFFNVLKGDMSLVGTRPPTLDEWNRYSPYYRSRLSIKPGITGLWQVSGRSNITDFNEVVKLDNDYIDNFSIKLDIKIIFRTIKQLFIKDDNNVAL